MGNNIGRETSLWELLKDTKIEIPIIQRDYAQGREDKASLREKFLEQLLGALKDNSDGIVLDFVYGTEIDLKTNKKLNPLDGQQRLTTLFLLHWYLAWKLEKLKYKNTENTEESKRLLNFTYETRVSSREFCKALVEKGSGIRTDNKGLSKSIENQSWFFKEYLQDPTISSMLRMLDDIDKALKATEIKEIENLWKGLTEEKNEKMTFFYLDLKGFKQTDDLYVKMNARGKALTPFENFKADLVGHIAKLEENDEKFKDLKLSSNIDNSWTDVFWKRNKDGKIDDIYFAFLNRFFLNELICSKENKDLKENVYFDNLYSTELDYKSFSCYENIASKILLEKLNNILRVLKLSEEDSLGFLNPPWVVKDEKDEQIGDVKDFSFIPIYDTEKKSSEIEISKIGQKQRIVFFGICEYLGNITSEKPYSICKDEKFNDWLRVLWNIVENTGVTNIDTMCNCMRFIGKLSKHSSDILTFLVSDACDFKSDKRLLEEVLKAKLIKESSYTENWAKEIKEIEATVGISGKIAFVLRASGIIDKGFKMQTDISFKEFVKLAKLSKELFDYLDKEQSKDFEEREFLWERLLFTYVDYTWSRSLLIKNIYDRDYNWKKVFNINQLEVVANVLNDVLTKCDDYIDIAAILKKMLNEKMLNEKMLNEKMLNEIPDYRIAFIKSSEMFRFCSLGNFICQPYENKHRVWLTSGRNKGKTAPRLYQYYFYKNNIELLRKYFKNSDDKCFYRLEGYNNKENYMYFVADKKKYFLIDPFLFEDEEKYEKIKNILLAKIGENNISNYFYEIEESKKFEIEEFKEFEAYENISTIEA